MTLSIPAGEASQKSGLATYAPGLVLVAVITAAAYGIRHIPLMSPLSPMILAIFVGMLFANVVGNSASASDGIALSGKRMLRLAVALLGLQISFSQFAQIGVQGVAMAAVGLFSTFLFTLAAGRLLGVERDIARLLAAGTSVCGASAIAAANGVIGADDEDVSYAVACITFFGTLAMFLFPLLNLLALLPGHLYGLWVGLSVHEVAQVVGAGFQGGSEAGEIAVVTKLARIMMLAPLIVGLSLLAARRTDAVPGNNRRQASLVPFFIVGFLALATANTFGLIPEQLRAPVVALTPVLLTAAMAALGLGTKMTKLRQHGLRPFLLAGMATAFIAGLGYLMVALAP